MNRFELDKNAFSRGLGRSVNMLLEISHSKFSETFYFINDTKSIVIDGKIYQPYPFDVTLPNQGETQGTSIAISNINNIAANEIRKTICSDENIIIDLKLVNIENEMVETYDCGEFELLNLSITQELIKGNLNIRNCFDVNAGSIRYCKRLFPNLFL